MTGLFAGLCSQQTVATIFTYLWEWHDKEWRLYFTVENSVHASFERAESLPWNHLSTYFYEFENKYLYTYNKRNINII